MLAMLIVCSIFIKDVSLEVQKDKYVTCLLTEDISVLNQGTSDALMSNDKIEIFGNDWFTKNSADFSDGQQFAPVTDTRWNELPIKKPTYKLGKDKLHVSLSVCVKETFINFIIIVQTRTNTNKGLPVGLSVPRNPVENCSWVHLTFWKKAKALYLTSANLKSLQVEADVQEDSWLRFQKFPKYNVKYHFYDFLWSKRVSRDASSFQIDGSPNQKLCTSFYVSLDEGCQLDITLHIDGKIQKKILVEGFNKKGELKTWEPVLLGPFDGTKGLIELHRRKTKSASGYWAIDHVRKCKDEAISEEKRPICRTFENTSNIICQSGFFGQNCGILCEDVLGTDYSHCQGHEMCGTSVRSCYCGFGYKWNPYENYCTGIDCMIRCGGSCSNCDQFVEKYDETSVSYSETSRTTSQESISSSTRREKLQYTISKTYNSMQTDPKNEIVQLVNPSLKVTDNKRNLALILTLGIGSTIVVLIVLGVISIRLLSNARANEKPRIGDPKVEVNNFEDYIKTSLLQGYLINQYNTLNNNPEKRCDIGLNSTNIRKNYDNYNIPYDHDRTILLPVEDGSTSDYINASYIDGWGRRKAYIVTQAPKFTTVQDFYRMVWQRDVKTIIMATNFRENLERKCFEYFPTYPDAILPFAEFGIKLVRDERFEFYNKRILEVYHKRDHKVITHYQLNWNPDQKQTLYPNYLVPIVKIMNQNYSNVDWNSIVVHCSLGVGRSAILVLCDLAFQMAKSEGYVDVYYLARMLREQRPNMITSSEDYILAHLVISECLMQENNNLPTRELIRNQLETFNTCNWHDSIFRNQNSPLVEGYQGEVLYFYCKQPQHETIAHFWELVIDKKIKMILFFNNVRIKLWPREIRLSERTICTIQQISSIRNSYWTQHTVIIEEIDVRTTVLYREEVICLQLCDWRLNLETTSIERLLLFENHARVLDALRKETLVCYLNGISNCGVFMALSHVIRKYLKELDYDLANAVRNIRRSNKKFVSNSEELIFLRAAVSLYSQRFDPYKNINNDVL